MFGEHPSGDMMPYDHPGKCILDEGYIIESASHLIIRDIALPNLVHSCYFSSCKQIIKPDNTSAVCCSTAIYTPFTTQACCHTAPLKAITSKVRWPYFKIHIPQTHRGMITPDLADQVQYLLKLMAPQGRTLLPLVEGLLGNTNSTEELI